MINGAALLTAPASLACTWLNHPLRSYHWAAEAAPMKRVLLVTSDPKEADHRYVEESLDRARIPFCTRAGTVPDAAGIRDALATGNIDILHFTDSQSARMIPVGCPVATVVTVNELPWDKERGRFSIGHLSDDLALADVICCETPAMGKALSEVVPTPEYHVVRPGVDVDLFDPDINQLPREHLIDFDDESKMLVAIGTFDTPTVLADAIEMLPEEVAEDLNLIHLGQESNLVPEQIISVLQHAEAILFADLSRFHRHALLHAAAAGCPTFVTDSEPALRVLQDEDLLSPDEPREWADELTRIHSEWRRAGGVPRHPDEELIGRMRRMYSLSTAPRAIEHAYDAAGTANDLRKNQ